MTARESLSANINILKRIKHISVAELIDILSISKCSVQRILKGKANPSMETLKYIADNLNVPPTALITSPYTEEQILFYKRVTELVALYGKLTPEQQEAEKEELIQLLDLITKSSRNVSK